MIDCGDVETRTIQHPVRNERDPTVELWLADTAGFGDSVLDTCKQALSSSEGVACEKLRREDDRRNYAVAHALLRGVLSRRLEMSPASVRFEVGAFGKPQLPEAQEWLQFSLSHTAGLVAIAVRSGNVVGVDVENIERPFDIAKLAGMLAPAEERQLSQWTGLLQRRAFLTMWTAKEAYMKARGLGLSLPLDAFHVRLATDSLAPIALQPAVDDDVRDWYLEVQHREPQHVWAVTTPNDHAWGVPLSVTERFVAPKELFDLLKH